MESRLHKLIILGDEGVGKTSIFSVMFLNSCPENTLTFSFTNGVSTSKIEFGLGNKLLIEDCGGQQQFQNEYFTSKKKEVFTNVDILVFVIEAIRKQKNDNDNNIINNDFLIEKDSLTYFENCLKALSELSPKAKIFVLIHKMDLIRPNLKQVTFENKKKQIMAIFNNFNKNINKNTNCNFQINCIPTSIWEKSLYTAWKRIMCSVEMNTERLKKGLDLLRRACGADDVAVFEKSTFLMICSSSENRRGGEIFEDERFDKFSVLIKKLMKSSLFLGNKGCNHFQFTNRKISAYIEEFTKNTLILIVVTKPNINFALFSVNIALTRKDFELILSQKEKEDDK